MDRDRNKICHFQVGDRSFSTYFKMALRLEKLYKIRHLCTDSYESYSKYRLAEHHHTIKAKTSLVEAKNSSLRDNLSRLKRRTKSFSKSLKISLKMLATTVFLHIHRSLIWNINNFEALPFLFSFIYYILLVIY